jgi:F0F1-type ATP synthase gamma subunit
MKLHKYFFQDGEMENIDTLINYNLNKIKINDNNENKTELYSNNDIDDLDYYNIKKKIINLMDEFSDSFDKENKEQLKSSIEDLRTFSQQYKFDYVTELTSDWLLKMQDKKYDNCQLKYIGYYNQIRDIIEKMLKELKKKVDFILL